MKTGFIAAEQNSSFLKTVVHSKQRDSELEKFVYHHHFVTTESRIQLHNFSNNVANLSKETIRVSLQILRRLQETLSHCLYIFNPIQDWITI